MLEHKKNEGFTIVEALVACTIAIIGIIPLFTLITTAFHQTAFVRDQLIAANLAQEGVELVRSIRDENWIQGQPFITGLGSGTYRMDYSDIFLQAVNPSMPLRFSSSTGYYTYSFGNDTPFSRVITITPVLDIISEVHQVRINVVVSWTTHATPFSVNVEDHLFDWYP